MVDYSKWKNIEVSDDEDDTHPNIDTPSLFRWRHQARVDRMEEMDKEHKLFEQQKSTYQSRLKAVKDKLNKKDGAVEELQKELKKLEMEGIEIEKKSEELRKKEKVTPWNVDTISKPGFQKTIINKNAIRKEDQNLTEEEREQRMRKFVKENEKIIKQYGMLRKFEDSRKFLLEHIDLVGENTANYLVIWCINLEMEKKSELMAHVAHQCICMQFILDLAKQLEVDPRSCVGAFFTKIQGAVVEFKEQFDSEIASFIDRIKKRAEQKIQEAVAEQEEEDRLARLGPGGLDPAEVFEELPEELKACFESRNIKLLQETISKMPEDDARYHMKRCVDSGLWVPDGGLKSDEGEGAKALAEENVYATAEETKNTTPKGMTSEDLD